MSLKEFLKIETFCQFEKSTIFINMRLDIKLYCIKLRN